MPKPTSVAKPPRRQWKKKPARRIAQKTDEDKAYLSWVHTQPDVLGIPGPVEASHFRSMTGMGRKEPDSMCIPMARRTHQAWEQHTGIFAGWTKQARREWFLGKLDEVRARYAASRGSE